MNNSAKAYLAGALLLVVPFSTLTGSVELNDAYQFEASGAFDMPVAHDRAVMRDNIGNDDAYRYEEISAFDKPQATHASTGEQQVGRLDMYAYEQRDAYDFGPGVLEEERVEIAVFAEAAPTPGDCIDWTE